MTPRPFGWKPLGLVLLALALIAGTGAPAGAAASLNLARGGLALHGYDPGAYFEEGKPVKGQAAHSLSWMGATWRFASAPNKKAFQAGPERYAPQYGGYCAWAVSEGYTADIDPNAWRIVNGKLYLNYSKSIQGRWEKDIPGHIAKADRNWPGVLKK